MGVLTRDSTPLGFEPQKAVSYSSVRTLTASAQRIQLSDPNEVDVIRKRRTSDTWQDECWEYFDAIGEVKYAMTLVGNVTSRVRLFAATVIAEDEPPISVEDASSLPPGLADISKASLNRLGSAHGGIAGLLRDAAINIAVAGECYLMQTPENSALGTPERWDIRSVNELLVDSSGKTKLKTSRYTQQQSYIDVNQKAFVGRVWRSHPRYSDEADSSLRALRDLCDEALLLARLVRATARSRLNAGALFVPDGLTVSAIEEQDNQVLVDGEPVDTTVADETDDFEDQLVEAMTTPIADEESASAVVPLLIRGPAELGDKIKPIKFERAFDAALAQRADKVIERILQGIDVPKDIVTGLANVKYSNSVNIDESLYKAHIEPLVLLLCDALTAVFLRPALIAAGWSPQDARKVVVWYDPSEILTRPDRASDANDGYDRFALSHEAWRRHHGFPETDAPTNDEIAMRLMISRGTIAPEVTQALLMMLVPDLMEKARQIGIQNSPAPLSPHAQEVLNPGAGIPGPAPNAQPAPPNPGSPPVPSGPPVPTTPRPVSTMPSPLPPEPVPTP